nr:reverse transcriptase domain-containing protein [Tanacetum cinerariifolium]
MAAEGNSDLPVPDLCTIEELCQPSLNGRGGPIAPIAIQATIFRLKNDMIQQSIKVNGVTDDAFRLYLFPIMPPLGLIVSQGIQSILLSRWLKCFSLRNKITNFRQRPDESLFEAWECYKLSIDRCLNHNMLPVTQIYTFYNGLTLRHHDTINAAGEGTFMKRRPEECYDLIKNMTAQHNDWDTSAQHSESSSSITSSFDTKIVALKAEMAEINKNLMRVLQVNQQVKAVTPNYETCGGPHSFYDSPATVGNTHVYAAGASQEMFGQLMKMNTASSSGSGTLSGNTITNLKKDLKGITTRRVTAYPGPTIPTTSSSPVVERETEVTKDTVHLANNESTEDVQPLVVPTKSPVLNSEPVNSPIIKPAASPVTLADLGASINLMPLSVCNNLYLSYLSPTCMTLELADHLISCPIGVAEDVYVKVGTFHFPTDFVVVDFDADPRVPLILRRSFLNTGRALIDVFEGELTLRVGKEAITFNLDQTSRYSTNYNENLINRIDVIEVACEEYSQEVHGFSDMIASGNPTPYYDPIVSTTSPTLTPFENSDFLFEEVDAFLALEDDPTSPEVDQSYLESEGDILLLEAFLNDDPSLPPPNQGNYLPEVRKELKICEAKSEKSSIDEPQEVKLKDLPPHLEYAFLEGDDKFSVIITKDLSVEDKTALIMVLKSHKRAIAWKLSDIKGIDPEFCTHKILMEEDFEPVVQHQRRVNPKIHDVIKQEVLKLLDAGLIYPISNSPWVSPVHCVPKKGGFTVIENEENELILTRLVTGWRVCIDYHQEKTTFTCPYKMFAYRRMPFGLCNAPGTFQRCMMAIFHDMIEKTIEVFMDDFSVFENSFQSCLSHLEKMLKRCEDTKLCLNWEKSYFMVKEGIVLDYKISKEGIEVDKAKVEVITKLPHPTTVKGIKSFLGHAGFYRRFIKDFSKIARPMISLLEKDTPFIFSKECVEAFQTLKRKLTKAPILIAPDWDIPFELMCDANDFAIGAVLGAENLAADHLSRLENPHQNMLDPKETNESFPLETLNLVSTHGNSSTTWFADFANYHAGNFIIKGMSSQQKSVYTARKPLTFSKLDTMDPPGDTMAQITQPRRRNKYILVAVDYLSKWVEAKAFPTNDARVVFKFLKNLFAKFRTPEPLSVIEERTSEMTIGENRASWSDKLDDALWAFQIAYKTPIGCTPYKLVYGKTCHLPIDLEHKAYWALKHANFDLQTVGDHRKVQLNELNELHDQAYENSLIYKEKTKRLHDSKIKDCVFNIDDRVLLFNSRLKVNSTPLLSTFFLTKTKVQNAVTPQNTTFIHPGNPLQSYWLMNFGFLHQQLRVLVTKPHNKTPYELLLGRTPSIGFMRPFGCPITIHNTLDPLGKFDGKADEGFLVGYFISSKAFRIFNSRIRIVPKTLHINFLENQPNVVGSGPTWLFDIDTLTQSMNYQPVVAGNQPNSSAGIQDNFNAGIVIKEAESAQQYVLLPLWSTGSKNSQNTDADAAFADQENESEVYVSPSSSDKTKEHDEKEKRESKGKSPVEFTPITVVGPNSTNNTNSFNVAGPSNTVVSPNFKICGKSSFVDPSQYPDDPNMPALEDIIYSDDEEDVVAETDFSNLEQEKGIDYEEVFAPVARIEVIRLFLAYASFLGFMVYKVVKALYGLHQAPRALFETLANSLLENGFQKGKIDQTLFIKKQKSDILLVQMSSMGELAFFLGLKLKQKDNEIFTSQDKYVAKILKKFGLIDGKSASTPIDTKKPLLKDHDGEDVDYQVDEKDGIEVTAVRLIINVVSSKLILFGLTD